MLYVLGGAARTGKSILSRRILKEKGVPYLSTDHLVTLFEKGLASLGINHGIPIVKKAKLLWPFLKPLLKHFLDQKETYLIEGDGILPSQVAEIQKEYPGQVKACFFGATKISQADKLELIRKFEHLPDEWTKTYSDAEVKKWIDKYVVFSKYLIKECPKYNLTYIEVGNELKPVQTMTLRYLFKKSDRMAE